jgi:nitroreductase
MEKLAVTDYPIEDILRRRWSPRAFSDRMVERETLQRLLEAARWAASSFNEQPWYFIVATKQNIEQYTILLDCLVEKNQQWARLAPVLMVSVAKLDFEKTGKPNRHAFHDVGLAMGNLIVQATAMDLFVHQMAGILPEKIREAYGIPNGYEPVAGVALGYSAEVEVLPEPFRGQELAPRKRKPIESFVFQEAWGETSSLVRS